MSLLGQKAKYSLGVDVFRFTPESGLMSDIAPCPFRAINGHQQAANNRIPCIIRSADPKPDQQEGDSDH
jgi:hypothetical protein